MVEAGKTVRVEYRGTFEDGQEFDSSKRHGKPLEFVIGSKQVVPGFDAAVAGMELNEEKDVVLQPADAYGECNDQLVHEVKRDQLPKDAEPKVGMMLMMHHENGMQFPAQIVEVKDDNVKIDPTNSPSIALTFSLNENERFEPFSTSSKTVERSTTILSLSSSTSKSSIGFKTIGASLIGLIVNVNP